MIFPIRQDMFIGHLSRWRQHKSFIFWMYSQQLFFYVTVRFDTEMTDPTGEDIQKFNFEY